MADFEVADSSVGQGNGGAAQSSTENGAIRFKRNIFINTEGTGVNTDRGRRQEGRQSEWVKFDESLQAQYETYLKNYIQNLQVVNKSHPELFESDEHLHDKELLQMLGGENGRPDESKIKQFLGKPEGWIVTTQVLEHQTALRLFALGLRAVGNPQGERKTIAQQETFHLNINRGILNRVWIDRIEPLAPVGRAIVGAVAASGLGATIATELARLSGSMRPDTAAAAGAGLALSAVIAGSATVRSLMRDGVTLNLDQFTGAFRAIQNNPAEAEFVKRMAGIDVDDFRVVGNRIENTRGVVESTRLEDTQNELLQCLYTREQFYTNLGIPRDRLDRLPEQFLYQFTTGQQEQTGARWQQFMQERFNPNEGGILDRAGLRPMDTGFNRGRLDNEGNITRFMKARSETILQYVQELTERERNQRDLGRPLSTVETKITERQAGGVAIEKRKGEIAKRKEQVDKDKTEADTQKSRFETYRNKVNQLRDAREQVTRELGAIGLTRGGAPVVIGDLDTSIRQLREAYIDNTAVYMVNGRAINAPGPRLTAVTNTRTAALSAIPFQQPRESQEAYRARHQSAKEGIEEQYRFELAALNPDKEPVDQLITRLEQLRNNITTLQRELEENSEVNKVMNDEFNALQDSLIDMVGWAHPGLNEVILSTETIDELLRRINDAHTANPDNGWPATENSNPENRTRLIHAMTEARARSAEDADPVRTAVRVDDYVEINGWGLTGNQLATLTEAQMNQVMNDRHTATGGTEGWAPADDAANRGRLRNAIAETRNMIDVRINVNTNLSKELNTQSQRLQRESEGVSVETELKTLEAGRDIMKRQGDILPAAKQVTDRDTRDKFIDTTVIDPTDTTYTQAEKDVHISRGYSEFMDLLFDYKLRPDRAEYFNKIKDVLPPQKMADLLAASLEIHAILFMPNLDFIQARIRDRLTAHALTERDMRRAFGGIIDRLKDEALAI